MLFFPGDLPSCYYRLIINSFIFYQEKIKILYCLNEDNAISSFRQYNKSPQQNISKEEVVALASLGKNKDIVIQKSDKGNSVVIVDKETYIKRMEIILSDQRKLERVTLKNNAFLNFVVNQKKKRKDTIFKNF